MPAVRSTLDALFTPSVLSSKSPAIVLPSTDTFDQQHDNNDHHNVTNSLRSSPFSVSYPELVRFINHAKGDFLHRCRLHPHDAVCVVIPNTLTHIVVLFGLWWMRAVAAPLNPDFKISEFQFYIDDSNARALIVDRNFCSSDHPARKAAASRGIPIFEISLDEITRTIQITQAPMMDGSTPSILKAAPVAADHRDLDVEIPRPNDVALLLHTSGTTGKPKGVPLSHANLMASIHNIIETYQLGITDTSLVVMPLFHVHGLVGATLSALGSGGTVVLPLRFSASAFWKIASEHHVTWYSAVPTIHHILLLRAEESAPLRTNTKLRFIRSCSSALAPVLMQQLESVFHVPVLEAYGMTEAAHQVTSNPLPPKLRHPGGVGKGIHVAISIMDEHGLQKRPRELGQVCIQGPNVTSGYRHNPEANRSSFFETPSGKWFCTGDQGFVDEDGNLFLTGRIKELINRGGEKISPVEVDSVILQHPFVSEAVTFGISDPKYGEEVVAAVVLKQRVPESESEAQRSIISFCKNKLAAFKIPKTLHIVHSIPKSPTGKIQRHHLSEMFALRSHL